jgi:hypothetical protein
MVYFSLKCCLRGSYIVRWWCLGHGARPHDEIGVLVW